MNKYSLLCSLTLAACTGNLQAAPLQNGDFETGDFSGWEGSLLFSGPVSPDADSHFSILPNAGPLNSHVAQIRNDDLDWLAILYQDFDLDPIASNETMTVDFWAQWSPTNAGQDGMSAMLSDVAYTESVDLLTGIAISDLLAGTWISTDITSFARNWSGQPVELAFEVSDADYLAQDSLTIDAIRIERHQTVPEPAALIWLAGGLMGWRLRKGFLFPSADQPLEETQ